MQHTFTVHPFIHRTLSGLLALLLLPLLTWSRSGALASGRPHLAIAAHYPGFNGPGPAAGASTFGTPSAFSASRAGIASTAAVYTWSATGSSAAWSTSGNWTPARTSPAASDILLFTNNGAAATVVLDFVSSQTIAGLFISTGSALTFSTDGTDGNGGTNGRTLAITNGSTGPDLTLDNTSTLTVYTFNTATTPAGNQGLTLALGSGATATIGGHLIFDSATATVTGTSQVLQGSGTNTVEFTSGSVFTAQTNFRGYPFGTGASLANSVVFRNGSRYEYIAGSTPFGGSSSSAVTSFEPASTFAFAPPSSLAASLSGRTYGNFEYNLPTRTSTATGSGTATIAGDLIMTAGTANINLTGGVVLKGNVLLNGGTLNFAPGSATTVQFAGTTAQAIGGTATSGPTFNANVTLQVNNAAGLTLGQPLSLPGALQLTSGLLTTSATSVLTLGASATLSAGSATSFVNGPLRRTIGDVTAATTFTFPLGKGSAYRPLALNISTQTGTTIYQAEQFEQDGGRMVAAPLKRVSRLRFFTLTPYSATAPATVAQPGGFAGTLTLSFGADDQVTAPAAGTLVVAKRADSSLAWATTGASTSSSGTASAGTLTSGSFTSFSDFALASTDADPTTNPLPVQLTGFAAVRAAQGGVALAWATASEVNSARFEVERSLDGVAFVQVAAVAAHGSSSQARTYGTRDGSAPLDKLYYRLRQVDTDGTATYSPAVLVEAGAAGELVLSPNPASTHLRLHTEQAAAYVVRNVLGQPVLAGTTQTGAFTLDISGLAAGVYFFELPGGAGWMRRRFTKN